MMGTMTAAICAGYCGIIKPAQDYIKRTFHVSGAGIITGGPHHRVCDTSEADYRRSQCICMCVAHNVES